MTGKDLFLSNLLLRGTDAVPVFLRDLTLALDETGYNTPEVCAGRYDAVKSARSVLALHRRLGQDAVVGCVHHVGMDIEALGGEVCYPLEGIPSIVKHPLQDMSSGLPEPDVSGQMPQVSESYRMVSEGLQGRAALACNLEGPVTKAALLRGMENLVMDMELQPDLAREIVGFAVEQCSLFMEAVYAASSPDFIFIAAATDNPDILGERNVRCHSLPGLHSLLRKARALGTPSVFHPHGDFSDECNSSLLEDIMGTGVDGFQFAEGNDPVRMRDVLSGRACVMGGIDAFTTLLMGPESRIDQEARCFLDVFRNHPGYVFMCSCSLHRGLPLSNVDALMRSIRSYVP